MDPMEHPCQAQLPKNSNLWLTPLLLGIGQAPRPSLSQNPFKQGSLLPPAGPLGSAPRARRYRRAALWEAPPPPYCTCPAEVLARNFAEPLPVSPRLSLLSPLQGERTSGGTSPPSLRLRSLRLRERSQRGGRLFLPFPHPFFLLREASRGAEL